MTGMMPPVPGYPMQAGVTMPQFGPGPGQPPQFIRQPSGFENISGMSSFVPRQPDMQNQF